jgi:hypothetical protein
LPGGPEGDKGSLEHLHFAMGCHSWLGIMVIAVRGEREGLMKNFGKHAGNTRQNDVHDDFWTLVEGAVKPRVRFQMPVELS